MIIILVENQKIKKTWKYSNKNYYVKKGYDFTKYDDDFFIEIKDLSNSSRDKIKYKCDKCDKEFEIPYNRYVRRINKYHMIYCDDCVKKFGQPPTEERREELYQTVLDYMNKNGYFLLSSKEDIHILKSKIKYICPIHGEQETTIEGIVNGWHCYKCSRENAVYKAHQATLSSRQKTLYEKAQKIAEEKGYCLLSNQADIINNTTYISYECPIHGVHQMRISNFINGKGCPECAKLDNSKRFRLDISEVIKRIESFGGKLLNPDEYINNALYNLQISCPECGNLFITSLSHFLQHEGQLCENCRKIESMGERKVRLFLENKNITFIPQYIFKDCRDQRPLPFDFYLPDFNIAIEYDGRQHYDESFFVNHDLDYTQKHDQIKNNYCKNNNIKLIRIPYWNYNKVEEILKKEIA